MPIKPDYAPITFLCPLGTSTLYVSEVTLTEIVEPFTRPEFDNNLLRKAKNALGGEPMITLTIANTPIQIGITCTGDSPRPLTANSLANLNSINQRQNITRYTLRGASCLTSSLAPLLAQSFVDQKLLLKFQFHQTQANSDIDYDDLVSLQSETFSYLSSTSTSIAGNCLGGTASSLIVRSYSQDVSTSVDQADGTQLLMATWSATLDNISFSSQVAS